MSRATPFAHSTSARVWLPIAVLAAVLFATACGPLYVQDDAYGTRYSPQTNVSVNQVDFGYLGQYGSWTNTARFGQVWVPDANRTPGWRPYFYGKWDYTSYGWTWASDEAWGSGPYHYGRWAWHNTLHWVWIPGNVWGPAWVSWRSGGGCVGWAPLGPRGYVYNHSTYWTFVYRQNIYRRSVSTVIIPYTQVPNVYRQTVRIGHRGSIRTRGGRVVTYNAGPRRSTVQTWTHSPVRTRRVANVRGASPRRRGPAPRATYSRGRRAPTQPAYRSAYRPAPRSTVRPTYRPAPSRTYRPAPSARRTYRPAPSARGRAAPSVRPTYRPAPSARRTYRPAPSARGRVAPSVRPTYRPAPSARRTYRPAPSTRGRAAPGRAAPGYKARANAYSTAPRARARPSRRSSSRGRSRRSTRSTRPTRPRPRGR